MQPPPRLPGARPSFVFHPKNVPKPCVGLSQIPAIPPGSRDPSRPRGCCVKRNSPGTAAAAGSQPKFWVPFIILGSFYYFWFHPEPCEPAARHPVRPAPSSPLSPPIPGARLMGTQPAPGAPKHPKIPPEPPEVLRAPPPTPQEATGSGSHPTHPDLPAPEALPARRCLFAQRG